MSAGNSKFVKAGDSITAATCNEVFSSIASASAALQLDEDNFANECFGARNLKNRTVCHVRETVEETSATASQLYTGSSVVAVGGVGGKTALEITLTSGITGYPGQFEAGDVLRVDWWQFISSFYQHPAGAALGVTSAVTFYPQWDLGAGYTSTGITTGTGAWMAPITVGAGRWRNTVSGDSFKTQDDRHCRGSGVFIATSTTEINGIRLAINPDVRNNGSGDGVNLRQGSLTIQKYRR